MSLNPFLRAPLSRRLFLASLTLTLLGCKQKRATEQRVIDLYVQSDGDFLAFKPAELTCRTGELVRLTFHHGGRFITVRHDWVLVHPSELESFSKDAIKNDGFISKNDPRIIAATPYCDKGGTVMTQFIAPAPGDYPFLCSTHPEDMRGILHVTK